MDLWIAWLWLGCIFVAAVAVPVLSADNKWWAVGPRVEMRARMRLWSIALFGVASGTFAFAAWGWRTGFGHALNGSKSWTLFLSGALVGLACIGICVALLSFRHLSTYSELAAGGDSDIDVGETRASRKTPTPRERSLVALLSLLIVAGLIVCWTIVPWATEGVRTESPGAFRSSLPYFARARPAVVSASVALIAALPWLLFALISRHRVNEERQRLVFAAATWSLLVGAVGTYVAWVYWLEGVPHLGDIALSQTAITRGWGPIRGPDHPTRVLAISGAVAGFWWGVRAIEHRHFEHWQAILAMLWAIGVGAALLIADPPVPGLSCAT